MIVHANAAGTIGGFALCNDPHGDATDFEDEITCPACRKIINNQRGGPVKSKTLKRIEAIERAKANLVKLATLASAETNDERREKLHKKMEATELTIENTKKKLHNG